MPYPLQAHLVLETSPLLQAHLALEKTQACVPRAGRVYWRSFLHPSRGLMHSTSQTTKWTPYEVKAAAIIYERRSEDLQLEQLRIRLQKKIREAEVRESSPAAA